MTKVSKRFRVIDLGTQITDQRRFAVWDTTVERFWKINNRQTWASVDELMLDFNALFPDKEKFKDVFVDQRDTIVEQASRLGFDWDLDP